MIILELSFAVSCVDSFSSLSMFCEHLLSVESITLWDSLNYLWDPAVHVILDGLLDGVAGKDQVLHFGELCQFVKLVPGLDSVVSEEEIFQLLTVLQAINLVDLVVRKPELFEGLADLVECHDSLNVVARQRQNFDVLQLGEGGHTFDRVR